MAEAKEVCKICFNSTSHKPNPTLTFEPKNRSSSSDNHELPSKRSNQCAMCLQEWAPIRVVKELNSSRWVRIRPRPKLQIYIDFMMCKNLNSRNDCSRGQDCSFAHSQAELWAWNQERQKEPRPAPRINGSYQYQLCKSISKTGSCPYGIKCTFAHNEEELESWLKVQGQVCVQPKPNSPSASSGTSNYRWSTKKQLETVTSSPRHRQLHAGGVTVVGRGQGLGGGSGGVGGSAWVPRGSAGVMGGVGTSSVTKVGAGSNLRTYGYQKVRPRPALSFHITSYRPCVHIQNGRRCLYGDYCTFAHSQAELDEWKQQIVKQQTDSASPPSISDVERDHGNSTKVSNLQLSRSFSGGEASGKDFTSPVRDSLAKEYKEMGTLGGLEETKEGVSVREVSGKDLAQMVHSDDCIQWVFEVTTVVPHTLHSVVLFDSLSSDFSLAGAFKCGVGGVWEELSGRVASAKHGEAVQLNFKMSSSDRLRIKVNVAPRDGILGQLVVFHVDSFHLLRCCVVRMLSKNEVNLNSLTSTRPDNVDLFWEHHYRMVPMNVGVEREATDQHLPEYPLPKQIEEFIKNGKYRNVENKVTKENYKRRMHNLLYLEEFQQRVDLSRYDLYGIEIKPESMFSTHTGTNYAMKGFHFIKVSMDELLLESGQTIRPTDSALLLPSDQMVAYECYVEHVAREEVVLKITEEAKQASAASKHRVSLRFELGRVPMRSMHYGVDQLDLNVIFPVLQAMPTYAIPSSPEVQQCLDVLKKSQLNDTQIQALTSMLDHSCSQVPTLVLGPFGCGKTRTLCDCIWLLAQHMSDVCVLVCTHSNSAANIYVENLHQLNSSPKAALSGGRRVDLKLLRLYFTGRRINTIPTVVQGYCRLVNGCPVIPTVSELRNYRIVVCTLFTARALSLMGLHRGHFTHIFIDEAAQVLESVSLIALCLANSQTKIVLAGDHLQLDPPVYSDIAKRYGLHLSLLERLYDLDVYESGVGHYCRTLLTENHRSHQLILDLPSQLFYKNKLSCKAVFPQGGPDFPAVKFVSVEGHEEREEDSPSYFNRQEVVKVVEQAEMLVGGGLRPHDVCVLAYYSKQVHHVRSSLRKKGLGQVKVHRVDEVQGRAYRALIITTVRTSLSELMSDKEAGFLTNPKLFNTAVTRAEQWLVVVGEPVTLCTVGSNRLCWLEYIRRCIGLKAFQHPKPAQFEDGLDHKIVTRKLLEKTHISFFKKVSSTEGTSSVALSQTSSNEQPARNEEVVAPTSHDTADAQPDDVASLHLLATPGGSPPVPSESQKPLSPPTSLTPSPITQPHAAKGSISPAPGSHVGPPPGPLPGPPPPTDDLPPFLHAMVESVRTHSAWCDQKLAASYPLRYSTKLSENLMRQKSALETQSILVDQQVNLYRDLMKLLEQVFPTQRVSLEASNNSSGPSLPIFDNASSQSTSPAINHLHQQQPPFIQHFPSALPSSYSNSPSGHAGLHSAFNYD